ncbi:MAG: peptide deformylase [Oscillospiraceae bacterium]|jgi:peptide deformylase|nr:peptide deformylase [Oscillospiraceae bacterium]
MAIRTILRDSDPSLRKKSRIVSDFNPRMHKLLDDMRETLLEANGLGLAAPQVGVLRRAVLVVDTSREEGDEDAVIELINPEIIAREGEQEGNEGCLSVPGVYGIVKRPETVTVRAFDRFGNEFEVSGEGLTARAFCHEIDHLDGILFSDLASRFLTKEELDEIARGDAEEDADAEEDGGE